MPEQNRKARQEPSDARALRACDLILQGGVTSGLVYSGVVSELATRYRFHQIGGTSAGAIGAALTAAAEYRRQTEQHDAESAADPMAGFTRIGEIPEEVGGRLTQLFQPIPTLERLFRILVALVSDRGSGRIRRLAGVLITEFRYYVLAAAVLIGLLMLGYARQPGGGVLGLLGFALALAGVLLLLLAFILISLYRDIDTHLPNNDFGLSTGLTRDASSGESLTDWLCRTLDEIAGLSASDAHGPLLVSHLVQHDISLVCMTTDLGSGRPYKVPFTAPVHYFRKKEFERLFPASVVSYLVEWAEAHPGHRDAAAEGYLPLAYGSAMPVAVLVRLSLSFPGLVSSVPLHRPVRRRTNGDVERVYQRTLFSDGGISSNFPIHLFDVWLPSRPTFGVSLARRQAGEEPVYLPQQPLTMQDVPVHPIRSLFPFLRAVFDTARNWQDNLQSLAPGYSERIVRIRLDPHREGGLNFDMSNDTIASLMGYGRDAAAALLALYAPSPADAGSSARVSATEGGRHASPAGSAVDFFDEHRYRRALSLMPAVEDALITVASRFTTPAASGTDYPYVLTEHPSTTYERDPDWRRHALLEFVEALVALGRAAPKDGAGGRARNRNPESVAYRRVLSRNGASVRFVVSPSDEAGQQSNGSVTPAP